MSPGLSTLDWLSGSLIMGALVGVLVRAYLINGQDPLSRETGVDAFFGVILAVAWVFPMPGVGIVYPPFAWPKDWPFWVPGVFFAGFTALFVGMAKAALLKWAPSYFEKWTGQVPNGKEPKP